ncbi:MAG: cupin domain-containing protein [Nitrososphaeria archaeon]|nr:cupin domain-containing protein [Nitrososphaeria archaeon]
MWKIIRSEEYSFEPYGKGIADIKRIMRQSASEGRFEGLGLLRVPSNGIFPKHVHPEKEEIYYILSGSGLLMVEDSELNVTKGDAVYISGNVQHGLKNVSEEALVVLYITAFK